jgi:hypothetical protein
VEEEEGKAEEEEGLEEGEEKKEEELEALGEFLIRTLLTTEAVLAADSATSFRSFSFS